MDHTRSGAVASTMLPVQQYHKHVALENMLHLTRSSENPTAGDINPTIKQSLLQSASVLPLQLRRFLDYEVAAYDALFALADVFRFAAYSEIQCLNLLRILIDDVVRQ